jgi:hypothetical protein
MPDSIVYFGRAGQIRKLVDPTGGMLATRDIGTTIFPTGSGGARVQRALYGTRQYSLNYGVLGRANFDWLDTFQQGHMGTGPFVLLDPGRRNALTVNQSAATSATNGTEGFTVSGSGGTISSDATLAVALPKTLKWSFATSTPATALLLLNKPSSAWPGIPIMPARPYTFWFMAQGGPIDLQAQVVWYDLGGAVLTTSASSTVTTSTTVPAKVRVTIASPPSSAVWATVQIAPMVATIASGESLFLWNFMLNEGSAPDTNWAPGTGVFPVQLIGMPEKYGFAEPGMLVSPTLLLQEVV